LTCIAEDRPVRIVASLLLVTALAGCGSHVAKSRGPIAAAEWKAVLRDWFPDATISAGHPCAAILIAQTHIPVDTPTYSTLAGDLRRAERHACPTGEHPARIRMGMSDADVAARAGLPGRVELHCWLYRVTAKHTGRRVCFTRGRVSTLETSVHG
jgi:hypothetical protein